MDHKEPRVFTEKQRAWIKKKIPGLMVFVIALFVGGAYFKIGNPPTSTEELARFGSYIGGMSTAIGVIFAGLAYLHQKDESRYSREKAEDLEEVLIASLSADEQLSKLKKFSELTSELFNNSLSIFDLYLKKSDELEQRSQEVITLSKSYMHILSEHIYKIEFQEKKHNRPERKELRSKIINIQGTIKEIRSNIKASIGNVATLDRAIDFELDENTRHQLISALDQQENFHKKTSNLLESYKIS